MVLVTLVLLVMLSVLVLNKSWDKKPKFMGDMAAKMAPHIDNIGLAGVILGFLATIIVLTSYYDPITFIIRLAGSLLVIILGLPFAYSRILGFFGEKMNPVIKEELDGYVGKLARFEKTLGFTGLAVAVLMLLRF